MAVLRQAHFVQSAGETESVQQPEGERNDPRPALRPSRPALARMHDFAADKHDAQRDAGLDGRCGTCTKPSVAAASVRLCATVNAVTVATRRRVPFTRISNARMNSR